MAGRIPAGEPLSSPHSRNASGLAKRQSREALMRLVSEGLVTLDDQRGFSVATVSRPEPIDITETCAEIEALAMRSSIENGDDW